MDLTDEQWEVVKPLIPAPPKRSDGRGRPRLVYRIARITCFAPHNLILLLITLFVPFVPPCLPQVESSHVERPSIYDLKMNKVQVDRV